MLYWILTIRLLPHEAFSLSLIGLPYSRLCLEFELSLQDCYRIGFDIQALILCSVPAALIHNQIPDRCTTRILLKEVATELHVTTDALELSSFSNSPFSFASRTMVMIGRHLRSEPRR